MVRDGTGGMCESIRDLKTNGFSKWVDWIQTSLVSDVTDFIRVLVFWSKLILSSISDKSNSDNSIKYKFFFVNSVI